jgi:hypothetical protein
MAAESWGWQFSSHLWAHCLQNVGNSTPRNAMGLNRIMQGEFYLVVRAISAISLHGVVCDCSRVCLLSYIHSPIKSPSCGAWLMKHRVNYMTTSTSVLCILCTEYGYPKNWRGGGRSEEADVWFVPLPMTVVRLNETDCSLEVQYDSIL